MKEMWQKTKDWVSPRLPFFCGAILPILIAMGACIFPFLYLFPTLREWGLLGKLDAEVMRNLILTIAGSITWLFLYRRAKSAEQNAKAAEQSVAVEQLTRAMEQLASDSPSIRLGGILGLEQIVNSHEEEREKVIRILSTRIRELTPIKGIKAESTEQNERQDIEEAVKALARIAAPLYDEKILFFHLQKTNLRDLFLYGINLSDFQLTNVNFNNTSLISADLSQAYLDKANFRDADLDAVDLSGASLEGANLSGAWLAGVDFSGANLSDADFQNARAITQEQFVEAFYRKGQPPRNLPDRVKLPQEKSPPLDIEKLISDKAEQ